ncbi:MAG: M28 family peptidase [Saprospiraceae bacterium]
MISCKKDPKAKDAEVIEEPPAEEVKVPVFESDSAYQYVRQQVEFGPRSPNSDAHRKCKDWLVAKLKSFGAEVSEQKFEAKLYTGVVMNSSNIVASFNPSSKKRVLLASHWDSRFIADQDDNPANQKKAILGADDGASGVGILLELARAIQGNPLKMGVDIVLFDAEDQGQDGGGDPLSWCIGSQHWAKEAKNKGYNAKWGILLDMVGAKNARFPQEGASMKYAPDVVQKVWQLAQGMGFGNYFVNEPANGITDDHVFVNEIAGVRMIDIINLPLGSPKGFVSHWHTQADDLTAVDKNTIHAVGQIITAAVYREANGSF